MILDTIRDVLDEQLKPEMKELKYVSDDSPDQVAENLADKISKNAMPSDGKIAPRFLGRVVPRLLGGIVKSTGKSVVTGLIQALLQKKND